MFHAYIKRDEYSGSPHALSMHPKIFRRIATEEGGYNYYSPETIIWTIKYWLQYDVGVGPRERINVAGKNFASFDHGFIRRLKGYDSFYRHRIIDPAMLFWNPQVDSQLPDTKQCMERAGLEGEVAHTALEDALVVAKLVRIGVQNKLG